MIVVRENWSPAKVEAIETTLRDRWLAALGGGADVDEEPPGIKVPPGTNFTDQVRAAFRAFGPMTANDASLKIGRDSTPYMVNSVVFRLRKAGEMKCVGFEGRRQVYAMTLGPTVTGEQYERAMIGDVE